HPGRRIRILAKRYRQKLAQLLAASPGAETEEGPEATSSGHAQHDLPPPLWPTEVQQASTFLYHQAANPATDQPPGEAGALLIQGPSKAPPLNAAALGTKPQQPG
ncbi:hypothetical protein H1C71_035640, partial [Ictidomys tridecemlineatus]